MFDTNQTIDDAIVLLFFAILLRKVFFVKLFHRTSVSVVLGAQVYLCLLWWKCMHRLNSLGSFESICFGR